jgi:hypothetical protein
MNAKRPPIEPLSRPAWERVEAGVFAQLDRGEHHRPPSVEAPAAVLPRRSGLWLAGVFAAAASLAVWWRVDASHEVARVAQHQPAEASGARIVTTEAPTQTTLGESVLVLAAHSDVNVSGSDAAGWSVRLESGEVDCRVAPRQGRPPFVVQAGAARVTVVGTRFSVRRAGAVAHVSVTEGSVQVDSGNEHLLLGPGESWPKLEPSAPLEPVEEAAEPIDAEPPAGPSKARPRAQQRFDRAARLESKDPRAALAIYQDLARGRGPWAANALYAEARLALELGHPKRAGRLLRRYLTRHPRGLNAPDVRKLLERIER